MRSDKDNTVYDNIACEITLFILVRMSVIPTGTKIKHLICFNIISMHLQQSAGVIFLT